MANTRDTAETSYLELLLSSNDDSSLGLASSNSSLEKAKMKDRLSDLTATSQKSICCRLKESPNDLTHYNKKLSTDSLQCNNSHNMSYINDDNMSQQVEEILESLDRFTFSSGKSFPLSSSKKKPFSDNMSRPSPIIIKCSEDNETVQMSPMQKSSSFVLAESHTNKNRGSSPLFDENSRNLFPAITPLKPKFEKTFETSFDSELNAQRTAKSSNTVHPVRKSDEAISNASKNTMNSLERNHNKKDVTDTSYQQLKERQNLLEEAWAEKERVRKWANDVRQAVQEWVRQHQALLECKTKDQEGVTQTAKETIKRYQNAVEQANLTIGNLEEELRRAHEHYHTVERRLHEIIQYQQNRLMLLDRKAEVNRDDGRISLDLKNISNQSSLCQKSQDKDNDEGTSQGNRWERKKGTQSSPSRTQLQSPTTVMAGNPASIWATSTTPVHTPKISPASTNTSLSGNSIPFSHHFEENDVGSSQRRRGQRKRSHRLSPDGVCVDVVNYGNGSEKEIHPDGITLIRFPNGDVKTIGTDGSVAYYYSDQGVIEVRLTDGSTEYEYPNGQKEHHCVDGRKIVTFSDGSVTIVEAAQPPN